MTEKKVIPPVKSICVTPIQNLSHKKVAMDGVDDEFVTQLNKAGFVSQKISNGAGQCDATTNAELIDITGRGRKTARIDSKINPDPKESAGAEHEAIVAALGKSAAQIDAANNLAR